jgi:energy-coupling factor transport system permease protein
VKAGRFLLWQSSILLLLHYLRFGADGVLLGLKISCQLWLAFLPGMIFIQGTSRSQLVRVASRFLSPTAAFVLGASLHFLPLLVTEAKELYLVQVLRGARIQPRELCKPWCWPDLIACLIVPATVQVLALAGDIALAARVRDFGVCRTRSCWPGTDISTKLEREL